MVVHMPKYGCTMCICPSMVVQAIYMPKYGHIRTIALKVKWANDIMESIFCFSFFCVSYEQPVSGYQPTSDRLVTTFKS